MLDPSASETGAQCIEIAIPTKGIEDRLPQALGIKPVTLPSSAQSLQRLHFSAGSFLSWKELHKASQRSKTKRMRVQAGAVFRAEPSITLKCPRAMAEDKPSRGWPIAAVTT